MPAGSSNFSGHITNTSTSPGGPGELIKTGNGQLLLSGSNTYAGGTTIDGGALLVQSTTGSATGSGSVTVGFGGTFAGTGTISGDALVLPGGTISPGNTGAGSLTVNNLILAGSTFNAGSAEHRPARSRSSMSPARHRLVASLQSARWAALCRCRVNRSR